MARRAAAKQVAIFFIAPLMVLRAAEPKSVTGAFEGWFRNPDGSATILAGYFNRNTGSALDIPIGEGNKIEPGGPDRGQPTHFLPGRQWGVFTIRVPKEFDGKLIWTLTVNGETTQIPLRLDPLWLLDPYVDASGNTPPWISFDLSQAGHQGPPLKVVHTERVKVGEPASLPVWLADDAKVGLGAAAPPALPPIRVAWFRMRGPTGVEFQPSDKPEMTRVKWPGAPANPKVTGHATTSAIFRKPGEYWLAAVVNDWSGTGGGGFQCCWTTAHVRIIVVE